MARLVKELNEIIGGNGGNWAYFAKHKPFIAEFIQEHNLTPARVVGQSAVDTAHARVAGPLVAEETTVYSLIDLGIRGGIRVPHLHLNDNIYLLDEKQWATLSKEIVADVSAKLSKVNEISFDNAMMISSIM
jgi:hypothetical protein